jgi:hypothetical protein
MACVTRRRFEFLARPISIAMFGKSKTWRGFVVMPLATVPGVFLSSLILSSLPTAWQLVTFEGQNLWILGMALGFSYVLLELPNSFLKRRAGVPPGKQAKGKLRFLFFLLDHLDSLTGVAITYLLLMNISWALVLGLYATGPLIHVLTNLLLYARNLRRERF